MTTIDFAVGLWVDTNFDNIADAAAGSVSASIGSDFYFAYSDANRTLFATFGNLGVGVTTLLGTAGQDVFEGSSGADTLNGRAGDDMLYGFSGNDVLTGGNGADQIFDSALSGETTSISAGNQNDRIDIGFSVFDFTGTINGGADFDSLVANGDISGLTISLVERLVTNGTTATAAQFNAFTDIRSIFDENAADPTAQVTLNLSGAGTVDFTGRIGVNALAEITASAAGNTITGHAGVDYIYDEGSFPGTSSTFNGGAGDDFLFGFYGNDTLNGGEGADEISDFLFQASDVAAIDGGAGNDRIVLDNGVAAGATGTIDGGEDFDFVRTSGDISSVAITNVERLLVQSTVTATIAQLNSFSNIRSSVDENNPDPTGTATLILAGAGAADFSSNVDLGTTLAVTVSAAGNTITGHAGVDVFIDETSFPGSSSAFNGGAGDDFLYGYYGNDTLNGGEGNDYIYDYAFVVGETAAIDGGAGDDRIELASSVAGFAGSVDGGDDFDRLRTSGDISGVSITNVERLLVDSSVTATIAQLNAFSNIRSSSDENSLDPTGTVSLTLADGGAIDFTSNVDLGTTLFAFASAAGNSITGHAGVDYLIDEGSFPGTSSTFNGGAGNDFLYGYYGNDTLNGGEGDDYIYDYAFVSGEMAAIDGGAGNDQIDFSNGAATGFTGAVNGGDDFDTLSVSGDVSGITITNVERLFVSSFSLVATVEQLSAFTEIDVAFVDGATLILADGGAIDFTLKADAETILAVNASSAGNTITGHAGVNQLNGSTTFGAFASTLNGGAGDDFLRASAAADTLNGEAGDDNLQTAFTGDGQILNGGADGDYFVANVSQGTVLGTSFWNGGSGNDKFELNFSVAASTLNIDGGADFDSIIVRNDISGLTLSNVEQLLLQSDIIATAAQFSALSDIRNVLDENEVNATTAVTAFISGAGAANFFNKVGTGATLNVTTSALGNEVTGHAGRDVFTGGVGADAFIGGEGNDVLNGGGGVDTITDNIGNGQTLSINAGAGNDRIILNDVGGALSTGTINGAQNTDTLVATGDISGLTISLVERLLVGPSGVSATAAQLSAFTDIRAFADDLSGAPTTAFTLNVVGAGTVTLTSNVAAGVPLTVNASAAGNTINGHTGPTILNGGVGNDILNGSNGDDTLTGGGGTNQLNGGQGADTYVLGASLTDTITETGGVDLITTTITRTLEDYADVENLRLLGNTAINAAGNALNNALTGNAGANTLAGGDGVDRLSGGNGIDTLIGGDGNDVLSGGNQADVFVFETALSRTTNVDRIADFAVNLDKIHLDDAIFTALGPGALDADAFHIGTAAADLEDRIIYNAANGALFYDANGSLGGGITRFGTLSVGLALDEGDFLVI